ncbi:MAG: RNA polymerase sigma factor [Sphingobacteriales bacterium]|nr:RNA polymerase sigma factor [Sphingobacteriales bacterium]
MQDSELIRSVLQGRVTLFTQLVKKYEIPVFRIIMGLLHNKEDAEEVTQDVFVKVYQSLDRFAGRSSFSTWLYRIAIHTGINFLRKRNRRSIWERAADLVGFASSEKTAEQLLSEKSDAEYIRQALDSLPEKQRLAFILTRYEELPQKEVADVLAITEGAVEQLLIRAKNNLRKKLENKTAAP